MLCDMRAEIPDQRRKAAGVDVVGMDDDMGAAFHLRRDGLEYFTEALEVILVSGMLWLAAIKGVPFIGDGHEGRGCDAQIHFGEAKVPYITCISIFDVVPMLTLPRRPFESRAVGLYTVWYAP